MALKITPDQKRRAQQLTNLFENGTFEFQYAYVENLGDGRGYTCGRIGFTTGTSDALEVVKRYTWHKPHNPLAKYLPELERLDKLPEDSPKRGDVSHLHGFPAAWKEAAKDPVFRAVQDELVDEWYFNPALKHAEQLGLKTALGVAVLYDTAVQHGIGDDPDGLPALVQKTNRAEGTPKQGMVERAWILYFLEVRENDLIHPHNVDTQDVWRQSVGRVRTLRQLVEQGNFDLKSPLHFVWEGSAYTLK